MNRKMIRSFIDRCANGRDAPTRDEMRELAAKAIRYEYLRTLNVPQFQTIFVEAGKPGVRFDELVDRYVSTGKPPPYTTVCHK